MKRLLIIISFFSIGYISACTNNSMTKNFGGTSEMDLPKGEKLLMVTWKDNNLWYLTRPMLPTDSATSYNFHEKSSWGTWEGTYIIHEVR